MWKLFSKKGFVAMVGENWMNDVGDVLSPLGTFGKDSVLTSVYLVPCQLWFCHGTAPRVVIGWMWLVTFSVPSGKEWGVQAVKFLSLVGHILTGVSDGLKLMTTRVGWKFWDYFPNIFSYKNWSGSSYGAFTLWSFASP